jgi:hypothetical protein
MGEKEDEEDRENDRGEEEGDEQNGDENRRGKEDGAQERDADAGGGDSEDKDCCSEQKRATWSTRGPGGGVLPNSER